MVLFTASTWIKIPEEAKSETLGRIKLGFKRWLLVSMRRDGSINGWQKLIRLMQKGERGINRRERC